MSLQTFRRFNDAVDAIISLTLAHPAFIQVLFYRIYISMYIICYNMACLFLVQTITPYSPQQPQAQRRRQAWLHTPATRAQAAYIAAYPSPH